MPAVMKTPGVYIVEKSAFPSSVVQVATAVPAFIGYTDKADNKGKSLLNKPWRITSYAEYTDYFGFGPTPKFNVEFIAGEAPPAPAGGAPTTAKKAKKATTDPPPDTETTTEAPSLKDADFILQYEAAGANKKAGYSITQIDGSEGGKYNLFYSMRLFFANGGGPCYIVSVGDYDDTIQADKLEAGIGTLTKEQEPTMVVIPEAILLDDANTCYSLQVQALMHCGDKMKNRITILDVYDGYKERSDPSGDPIDAFRDGLGTNFLDFATAYYPWVDTTIVLDTDLSYENIRNPEVVQSIIRTETGLPGTVPPDSKDQKLIQQVGTITNLGTYGVSNPGETVDQKNINKMILNKSLVVMSELYKTILKEMAKKLNLLPPSAAMAGIYTMVDNDRGVWKSPANVSLASVVSPALEIDHAEQEDLNVTTMGKSINALRSFIGEGTLVWGARTLDGNSLDWRYINVRRTMIMLEESVKLAAKKYVFENNNAGTWSTIKGTIVNFLTDVWKQGGLAGATPGDAFGVFVGLGETMTPEDILEGRLRVTVLVALQRPAEFIEITFQQQMQTS